MFDHFGTATTSSCNRAGRPRRNGGMHPHDVRGQYVSNKATSKRRLHAAGLRRAGEVR